MRIGVIRGDLQGPLFIADVETTSQYDPMVEPVGQERYVGRPTIGEIEEALASRAGAGANLMGSDIGGTYPVAVILGAEDLRYRLSATAAFTTVSVAIGVYADADALVAAINLALQNSGVTAFHTVGAPGTSYIHLEGPHGVHSYLEIDSIVNGSTFNAPAGFAAGGTIRTMAAAADFIAACLPVGGPLDVSTATINGVGAGTAANALLDIPTTRGVQTLVAEAIAPAFVETDVAVKSFQVGQIAGFRNALYNPDPHRFPNGAAISVVADDGVTPFAAPLPTIVAAQLNVPVPGAVTITGTGLGNEEIYETTVKFTGALNKTLLHRIITAAGGVITDTLIVIPPLLVAGATVTTTSVQVKYTSLASARVALT